MRNALYILAYVVLLAVLPFGYWHLHRCNCKDVVVLGHSISGLRLGDAEYNLHIQGVDEYDGTPCVRIINTTFLTFKYTEAGDSIHYEANPF